MSVMDGQQNSEDVGQPMGNQQFQLPITPSLKETPLSKTNDDLYTFEMIRQVIYIGSLGW